MHFIYQPYPQITTTIINNTQSPAFFYYNPIIKNENNKQKVRFSKKEDDLLRTLVNNQKDRVNWKTISQIMNGRTPRQCRERYNDYLRPNILNGKWTDEEDQLLLKLHEKLGSQWSTIAQHFPQRSRINIKNHYRSIVTKQRRNIGHEIDDNINGSSSSHFQRNSSISENANKNKSKPEGNLGNIIHQVIPTEITIKDILNHDQPKH